MARMIDPNNNVKYGLSPPKLPEFHLEPTEKATIPVWQADGSVKYVTPEDFAVLMQYLQT